MHQLHASVSCNASINTHPVLHRLTKLDTDSRQEQVSTEGRNRKSRLKGDLDVDDLDVDPGSVVICGDLNVETHVLISVYVENVPNNYTMPF